MFRKSEFSAWEMFMGMITLFGANTKTCLLHIWIQDIIAFMQIIFQMQTLNMHMLWMIRGLRLFADIMRPES